MSQQGSLPIEQWLAEQFKPSFDISLEYAYQRNQALSGLQIGTELPLQPLLPTPILRSPSDSLYVADIPFPTSYGVDSPYTLTDLDYLDQGQLWGGITEQVLHTDPALSDWWDYLRPDPEARWNDLRSSTDFLPLVDTLGFRARGALSKSKRLWELVKTGYKVASTAKRFTPMGLAFWGAEQVAGAAVIDLGKWVLQNYEPLPLPPHNPILPPKLQGARQVLGFSVPSQDTWGAFASVPENSPTLDIFQSQPLFDSMKLLMEIDGVYR